jgi:PilZ domain
MAEPHCPRCKSEVVERAGRAGLLERLLSVAYVYPFRCQSCLHRFRLMVWGQRYVRTQRTGLAERRQHTRHTVDFWTTLWLEKGGRPGRARDLSAAGMSLETDASLEPGQHLELDLQPAPDERPIRVEVAVVRSVQSGRVGLQFVQMKDDGDARLQKFLAGREAPAPPDPAPTSPARPADAS